LSTAAYSIYLQVHLIAGRHSSISDLRTHHAVVTRIHLTYSIKILLSKLYTQAVIHGIIEHVKGFLSEGVVYERLSDVSSM
jgi:hypothetical protein